MTPLTEDELAGPLTAGLESMLRRWETGTATLVGEFGTQDEGEALHYAAVQLLPLIVALRATPVADTAGIDAAWREAEAALPEGWLVVMLWRTLQEPWGAHAAPFPTKTGDPGVYAGGDTLAAALLALAAALRTPKPEGETE